MSNSKPATIHRVVRKPIFDDQGRRRSSKRGLLFSAYYEGELIVEASVQPLSDACRVLKARGLTGPVDMWDEVRPYALLQATIEYEASATTIEGDNGLRTVKWQPMPPLRGRVKDGSKADESIEIALTSQTAAGGSTAQQESEEGE